MLERAERTFAAVRGRRLAEPVAPGPSWLGLRVPIAEISRLRAYATFLDYVGRPAEATEAIERALALAPHRSDLRFLVGLINWRSGARARAISTWEELLRRDPAFEDARRALAEATQLMGSGR
jgi:tetratricopeptide (TPR) repeat protein